MLSVLSHLVLFFLFPSFSVAQSNGIIGVNHTITTDEADAPLLSESGDFAFGFYQLHDNDCFLLAIWYNKIPEKTVVWYPNVTEKASAGSKVQLTTEGLVLKNPQNEELWRSLFTGVHINHGVLDDTGNLKLVGNFSNSLWETFEHPADTFLPGQILKIGGVLSSRLRDDDFSRGRFEFRFLEDGNAVLNTYNKTYKSRDKYTYNNTYYVSGTNGSGYRMVFRDEGLYIERRNEAKHYITRVEGDPASAYYYRATLNFDGVFTVSKRPKNSTANDSWSVIETIPENICLDLIDNSGSGPCGHNNICSLGADGRPICNCQPWFSLDVNDIYGGCKANFSKDCKEDRTSPPEALYELVELPNTDWVNNNYEVFSPFHDIEECKTSCLYDCQCDAAVYVENSCWMKKLPLTNGRSDWQIRGTTALLKVRKNNSIAANLPSPQVPDAKKQGTLIIVGSVLLGSSVSVNFLLGGTFCLGFLFYYQKKLKVSHPDEGESVAERTLRQFTYKELVEATNGFDKELGRGSCGIVYKGEVQNFPIAVKKLDRVFEDNDKEFKTEVNIIGRTHHKNLVRLLGFCAEEQHRVLVYEFLSNGSLASFLFGDFKPTWSRRTNIASGIARGLFYLHEECHTQIIHCDIKPQNILLDESYNARISDFGLAKLLAMNQSGTDTDIRGTKGYVAPEWFKTSSVTVKVDVYSFGVVLLEILCCRRNVDIELGEERRILTDWAYDCYQEGQLGALVEDDPEATEDIKTVERFLMVAIWCLQEDPSKRPTMKRVMLMLEGIAQVPAPPGPYLVSSVS